MHLFCVHRRTSPIHRNGHPESTGKQLLECWFPGEPQLILCEQEAFCSNDSSLPLWSQISNARFGHKVHPHLARPQYQKRVAPAKFALRVILSGRIVSVVGRPEMGTCVFWRRILPHTACAGLHFETAEISTCNPMMAKHVSRGETLRQGACVYVLQNFVQPSKFIQCSSWTPINVFINLYLDVQCLGFFQFLHWFVSKQTTGVWHFILKTVCACCGHSLVFGCRLVSEQCFAGRELTAIKSESDIHVHSTHIQQGICSQVLSLRAHSHTACCKTQRQH